nr:MAG TPA: hypothetical protein [Caudoviricetes sp.]
MSFLAGPIYLNNINYQLNLSVQQTESLYPLQKY